MELQAILTYVSKAGTLYASSTHDILNILLEAGKRVSQRFPSSKRSGTLTNVHVIHLIFVFKSLSPCVGLHVVVEVPDNTSKGLFKLTSPPKK